MWYENDYRRIFMDMHLNDTNPEYLEKLDVKDFVASLHEADASSIVVKAQSHVGLHYWPSKYGKMHETLRRRNLDYVGEMIKECHKNNINVILYFSQVYDNYSYDKHKSWRIRDIAGTTSRSNVPGANRRYGLVCPNNPEYREYCKNILTELVTTYDFEGFFLDMPFWPRLCYCPSCQKRYLKETGMPLPIPFDHTANWDRFLHVRQQWIEEFMEFNTNVIKSLNPNISIEHNMAAIGLDFMQGNTEQNFLCSDYAGGDYYGGYAEQSFMCKYFNNMTPNKPFSYITSRCDNTLFFHTVSRTYEDLLIHAVNSLVHGGAFSICDAMNPDGTITKPVYENEIKKVFAVMKPLEKYVSGNILSDVAVYYNTDMKTNKDFISSPHHMAAILREKNIAFDVIGSKNIADTKAKVITVNNVNEITDSEADDFGNYVKRGGKLFVTGNPGGNKLFEDLIGIEIIKNSDYTYSYLNPTEKYMDLFEHFTKASPYPVEKSAIEAKIKYPIGTEIMATLSYPYTKPKSLDFSAIHSNPPGIHTSLPAMISRKYGDGEIVWCATVPESTTAHNCREALAKIILSLVGDDREFNSNAPEFVEILKWTKGKKTYLSVVNQQNVSPVYPICNIKITVNKKFKNAKFVSESDSELSVEYDKEKTILTVPETRIFNIIELY